jgi:ribosomal protein S17
VGVSILCEWERYRILMTRETFKSSSIHGHSENIQRAEGAEVRLVRGHVLSH